MGKKKPIVDEDEPTGDSSFAKEEEGLGGNPDPIEENAESAADSLKPKKEAKKGKSKPKGESKEAPVKIEKAKKEKPIKTEREVITSAVEFQEKSLMPPGEVEVETVMDPETKAVEVESVTIITATPDSTKERTKLAGWALHKLYEKSHRILKMMYKDLRHAAPEEQAALLTKAFNARKQPLVILTSNGVAVSVVSPRHKQFSLDETREQIHKAVQNILGEVEIEKQGSHMLFKLPIANKYVSAWLRIIPGNNLAKGPSAIHFSTSFRTEFDTKSGGTIPGCANWANVWTVPSVLFNTKIKRLDNLEAEIGSDAVDALTGRNIHTLNKAGIDVENLKAYVQKLTAAVPKMNIVIEKAIHQPLSKDEMKVILTAYSEKVGLPKYLVADILDEVQEETVWGLSQAVSFVRTHCDYRGIVDKKGNPLADREDVKATRVLENIAGEVYSIAPMIADLQSKEGSITYKVLGIKAPKEKPIKVEPVKKAKTKKEKETATIDVQDVGTVSEILDKTVKDVDTVSEMLGKTDKKAENPA